MTPLPRWALSLQATLKRLADGQAGSGRLPRVVVVGIGHTLRGDDGAGPAVIGALHIPPNAGVLTLNAGHAPENVTASVRRFEPDLVLLVDMAQMNLPPGSVQWLPWQAAAGLSASSHTLPLNVLARYLIETTGCEIALLGIQPAQTELDAPLSPEVATAVAEVATLLAQILRRTPVPEPPPGS